MRKLKIIRFWKKPNDDEKIIVNSNSIGVENLEELLSGNTAVSVVDKESQKDQSEKSDNTYQAITQRIVEITEDNLIAQEDNKAKLRKPLHIFIIVILSIQLLILATILFGNNAWFKFDAEIIKTYIVSVFAETLLGLTVMIRFAFSNKQEVELISILNSVVSDFKVFGTDNKTKENDKNKKD